MKPIISFVFKPTEDMPLLKLCTTRASDYLMSECDIERDRKTNHRNEYIMLFSPEVEVSESANEWLFLNSLLWSTAEYAYNKENTIIVSDMIDMGLKGKYCGIILLLPESFETPDIVKCH